MRRSKAPGAPPNPCSKHSRAPPLRRLFTLLLPALVCACQAPPVETGSVDWVAPQDRAVWLGDPAGDQAMQFVRFADIWQREDYGYVDRDGVTAELVFLTADRRNTVALEFQMATEEALRTFPAIASASLDWGPAEAVPGWGRELFYRRFMRQGANRACMGFAGGWDHITEDKQRRPRHAVFGYICNPAGAALTQSDAEALARRIRVRPPAAWRSVAPGNRPDQPTALAFARGTAERGNPSFPFRLARFYVVGNGRSGFQ